jgi:hypothetical protein
MLHSLFQITHICLKMSANSPSGSQKQRLKALAQFQNKDHMKISGANQPSNRNQQKQNHFPVNKIAQS